MDIFEKGDFQPVPVGFLSKGRAALEELSSFQTEFGIYDTDTTINAIRDGIIANYLDFDLVNMEKHDFDAKRKDKNEFLEVKQCSFSSKSWGGTWNDTNEEKARAFSDKRLFTVVAMWQGATNLAFMIYGQNAALGEHLHRLVVNRKEGSRSTQSVSVQSLIKDFGFSVIVPPDKTKEYVCNLLVDYDKSLLDYVGIHRIKTINDV
jgi:hypothetical protein